MLNCFNGPQDLRPDIGAFHALQITPRRNPAFGKSMLDRLSKLPAVCTRIRDEDPIGRELHSAIIRDSWSFAQPTLMAPGYRTARCRSHKICSSGMASRKRRFLREIGGTAPCCMDRRYGRIEP